MPASLAPELWNKQSLFLSLGYLAANKRHIAEELRAVSALTGNSTVLNLLSRVPIPPILH